MPAKHVEIGECAHDLERQAIRFLVDGLDESYTVFSNAWLVQRNGSIYEVDAVVCAPHALYVVEIKSYRGRIEGNDNDWYVPSPMRSPIKLNRKTAQILKSELRRHSYDAGRSWVEGFVFLSETENVHVSGPASDDRIHTRASILDALRDRYHLIHRLTGGRSRPVDRHTANTLHQLLTGVDRSNPPPRKIREYKIEEILEQSDRFTEYVAQHELLGRRRVLRFYRPPRGANKERRTQFHKRWRWEATVLGRVGKHDHIIGTDTPFEEEEGVCLPIEYFAGISLSSWLERYASGSTRVDLSQRVALWRKIARAMAFVHKQGVVHRQLRPEVILVEDKGDDPDLRIVGFDLAKQLNVNTTVAMSQLRNDRLHFAAPEVIQQFSNAEPRSDQFSLGAILGLIVTGKAPFGATVELLKRGGLITPLHELDPLVPHRLDAVAKQMLAIKSADRFESVEATIAAVDEALADRSAPPRVALPVASALDPEALEEGQPIGADYRIEGKLGEGGLATVYAARHLPSGEVRALKVARPNDDAEEALRGEHRALLGLSHQAVVRTYDITSMIPERLTMVIELIKGQPLSKWLVEVKEPAPNDLRRYAEDLLGVLTHLEEVGCTHKDLKPDNLLVGKDGLHVIDFSLADIDADVTLVGTALYRDPAMQRWDHAADRFAAAICLCELFCGRHPFSNEPPGPGDQPDVERDDFEVAALSDFFRKCLDPNRARRFQSAAAMRAGLLDALGRANKPIDDEEEPTGLSQDAALPLSATSLSAKAAATLRRAGVRTQGDLLALEPAKIRGLRGLGGKRAAEALAFRDSLLDAGLLPSSPGGQAVSDAIAPTLIGERGDLVSLGLAESVTAALRSAGYVTVGRLAGAAHEDLKRISGLVDSHVAAIDAAMQRLAQRDVSTAGKMLAQLWDDATEAVDTRGQNVLRGLFGFDGPERTQTDLAAELKIQQSVVSRAQNKALDTLDLRPLADVVDTLDGLLEVQGGIIAMHTVIGQLNGVAPVEKATFAAGVVRVLARLHDAQMRVLQPADGGGAVLCRPTYDKAALDRFVAEAYELAQWPPADANAAEASLAAIVPEYPLSSRSLARQLVPTLRTTESGELFIGPVRPADAIPYVLRHERPPIALADLQRRVSAVFRGEANWPDADTLPQVFDEIDEWKIVGDEVVARESGAVVAPVLVDDALPDELVGANRSPAEIVLDRLREASGRTSFRLVVTPPDKHLAIGRSLAKAIGPDAEFISFEQAFLERIDSRFRMFERAEIYAAQRGRLNRECKSVFEDILNKHGKPGGVRVLGDTGLWELCDALDLVRRTYDTTLGGTHGFWVLVIPGTIHQRQPRFNGGKAPVFHMPGAVLPLREPVAAVGGV